VPYLWFA